MKKLFGLKGLRIAAAAVVLILTGIAFYGGSGAVAGIFHFQFAPALMRCFAAFSAGALATVLAILVLTLLFGRIYCSMFCPFGILQDLILIFSRKKSRVIPNLPRLRYAVAGIVFGLLFCGWSAGLLLLDPYTNFGRIAGAFTSGGFVPLVIIFALVLWKRRIYCTAICPVGTLLGLTAKFSVFRPLIQKGCVKCGKCARLCPAGCIDVKSGTIDSERCLRCMNCIAGCPLGKIRFERKKSEEIPVDESRRAFLVNGGVLLAGLAAGALLARTGLGKLEEFARKFRILPPGAGSAKRFAAKCTGCQLCTKNCPEKIIVPAKGAAGPVSLDLSRGSCRFDCNKCSRVCPTGAIRPLTLATKQKTKIAEAHFNPQNCIVFQDDEECGKCAAVCPTHAITLRKNGTPRGVNLKLCIGCGACQEICPAPEKAMTVHEIEKQILLEN